MSRKNTTIVKGFGRRLRALIEDELKITQVEFREKLKISQSYLSMIMAGQRGPSADLIAGLYLLYSDYMPWLLTGEWYLGHKVRKGKDQGPLPDSMIENAPWGLEPPEDHGPLDIELLTGVIKGIEDYLLEAELALDPDKKARLISLLYERFARTGEEVDQETVVSYLKLVS